LTHYCGRLGRVPRRASPSHLAGGFNGSGVPWISFEPGARVPNSLRHRIVTADAEGEGATIRTHHDELKHWGSWKDGLARLRWAKQRSGQPSPARSPGIRWSPADLTAVRHRLGGGKNGVLFSGDEHANQSLLLVRETGPGGWPMPPWLTARDGLPDNVPGYHNEQFHSAIPITIETGLR